MSDNPYAAPQSQMTADAGTSLVYSPGQVAAGAFVGGPVGLIYFLRENFLTLGDAEQAKKCLIWGAVLLVALLLILPVLPDKFPSMSFTVAYMIAGQQIANTRQLTKSAIEESPHYAVQSNWRVFGAGLLCLLGSMLTIFVPLFLLGMMGSTFNG